MMALVQLLEKTIDLYNERREEEYHITIYDVRNEMNDFMDEKELQQVINEILINI